ncbi:ATP-binding protein [bacterium]|nr:ATP-binding protein [bacterium]
MIVKIPSATITGPSAHPVCVEVGCHNGLPSETIVGLPDAVVKESRSRIRSAIRYCKYEFPARAITINLAPAELKKEGPFFDLPIAIGILQSTGQLPTITNTLFVGELGLGGDIRPVRGIISIGLMAIREGYSRLVVPFENAAEASLLPNIEIIPIERLNDIQTWASGQWVPTPITKIPPPTHRNGLSFDDVYGQWMAKRALEIAASGNHNILLNGPPGSGKTMLIRRLPTILPPLQWTEALESLEIQTLIPGNHGQVLSMDRPFRSPHHTISYAGMVGGGSNPLPGEISLAHNGILFLDELPEFPRPILELLRQPLEDRKITISRASASVTYPANFSLVAAMNPCPCGYHGDNLKRCTCNPQQISKYIKRISGPLLDRIDIIIDVPRPKIEDWNPSMAVPIELSTIEIQKRVIAAQHRQLDRGGPNATLSPQQLHAVNISTNARHLIGSYLARGLVSGRSHDKILRVAQTIADLSGAEQISEIHVAEAIQLRSSLGN